MAKTKPKTTAATAVEIVPPAVQVVNTEEFGLALLDMGNAKPFMSFDANYDMDELDSKGQPKKMKKTGNYLLGKGLRKFATTQMTANWKSSQVKTESRGGEFSGKGNWFTAVIVKGKVTPLAVHKDDVETTLPDDAEKDTIANRVAIVRMGGLVYKVDRPRLYLRYEIVREKGDAPRAERKAFSKSEYRLPDGTIVDKKEVEPFLKVSRRIDETDIQVCSLSNVTRLAIDGVVFKVN
tara:strand:+ start:11818 stop:12528 length:711 start_codon:yes stop_codon:yes gene_type:complete